MGYEMAMNLWKKRFVPGGVHTGEMVVCDSREEVSRRFVQEAGGERVNFVRTPHEAVFSSSTIITMLPSSPHVRSVYQESPQSILAALRELPIGEAKKTLCIDSTTCHVNTAQEVATSVNELAASMIDAPVSGGVTGAKAATLSFLVGGPETPFAVASPILALMGGRIIHCGPSGAGLAAKICNNMILGVQQVVVAEAMLLGEKLGLDAKVLAGVINSSTGRCWASEVNNPVKDALEIKQGQLGAPCQRKFEGGFATALMLKDMGLATEVGRLTDGALPLGLAAEQIYAKMIEERPELADKDFSSVYSYLQENTR